jgi:hypothetical protein
MKRLSFSGKFDVIDGNCFNHNFELKNRIFYVGGSFVIEL